MLEGGALFRKGAGDEGRGQVRCRGGSRVCEWEAGSASPRREGCTVAAEAPSGAARRKNQRAVQKTNAFYILVSKMQMSCCEILIHSFTNLNIYKGIKFLKLEVLNNYHKETFTVPTYEVTSMSL